MPVSIEEDLNKAQASLRRISKALRSKAGVPSQDELSVPVKVFQDRRVGVLEATVIYLKDQKGLSYHEIAHAMSRDDRTIWTAYHQGKKKQIDHGKA